MGTYQVIVCRECAVGISYGDWTHLDYSLVQNEADEEHKRLLERLEGFGELSLVGPKPADGYFRCELCGMDHIDDAVEFAEKI